MNTSVIKFTTLALMVSLLFSSCANTADGRLTQAQGAGGGAVVGALLGVALGAATGSSNLGQYAAIGAASGALAGFAYGSVVAKKKAQYAKQEDFLDYAIAQAETDHQNAVAKNQQLAADVRSLESQTSSLAASDQKAKSTWEKSVKAKNKELEKQTVTLDTRIRDYNDCLKGDGYGNKAQSSTLRTKIQSLESEKAAIQGYQKRLAAAQTRIAI